MRLSANLAALAAASLSFVQCDSLIYDYDPYASVSGDCIVLPGLARSSEPVFEMTLTPGGIPGADIEIEIVDFPSASFVWEECPDGDLRYWMDTTGDKMTLCVRAEPEFDGSSQLIIYAGDVCATVSRTITLVYYGE